MQSANSHKELNELATLSNIISLFVLTYYSEFAALIILLEKFLIQSMLTPLLYSSVYSYLKKPSTKNKTSQCLLIE